jgi:DNA-binding CsgD family transcriptional regulator
MGSAVSKTWGELVGSISLLANVAELKDPRRFAPVVMQGLAAIVPCDVITYNEINLSTATVRWSAHPLDAFGSSGTVVFTARVREHPILRRVRHTARESEPNGAGQYWELLRPAGAEHRMTLTLHEQNPVVIGVALNRLRGDFTGHERDVVQLLAPPLAAAYQRLQRREQAVTALQNSDAGELTKRECEVLELVAAGRTDVAIGHLLGCSHRTVGKHLEHIYRKLGVANRAAAAARIQSE